MAETILERVRRWLGKTNIVEKYRKIKTARLQPKYIVVNSKSSDLKQDSVIFLCPSTNVPKGGVKVIYNQAAAINELRGQLAASVLHPLNPEFSCSWFNSGAILKKNNVLDRRHDFVIIPEFWAVPHARLLRQLGVRYGIYVQGGYIFCRDAGAELDDAYHNAALILAISDDTVECIKMAFPACADKVHRIHCSVDPKKFTAVPRKENTICYMPRRLRSHSQLVTYFLKNRIPSYWRIVSIDGLNEDGVAAVLGRSKIFLSFSELEGFSLPPVEAALSGCHVIGYTGEAAKEYWDKEIFTEIYSGDIRAFVNAVLSKIEEMDNFPCPSHTAAIEKLANKYSSQVEMADMQFVSLQILKILDGADVK